MGVLIRAVLLIRVDSLAAPLPPRALAEAFHAA